MWHDKKYTHMVEKPLKFFILLFCLLFSSANASSYNNMQSGFDLYSEYYPNPGAKFKGNIIFENGSGVDLTEWKSNQAFFNCAKQNGSVFLYDRSGLGKSPPNLKFSPDYPLTAQLVGDQLLTLLLEKNIKPPYIIVAHSYGAIYVGYFVLKHPELVKGLILVDPVGRDFIFSKKIMKKYQKGLQEAKTHSADFIYKKYGAKAEVIYQLLGFETSKQSIKQLGMIDGKIPVIVLSSTEMEKTQPIKADWYESQKQWLNENPNSRIIRVTSSHFIQIDQPQIVCDAIKSLSHDD